MAIARRDFCLRDLRLRNLPAIIPFDHVKSLVIGQFQSGLLTFIWYKLYLFEPRSSLMVEDCEIFQTFLVKNVKNMTQLLKSSMSEKLWL